MRYIIASRHPAAIAFARADARFATATVIEQATVDDVRYAIVAGNLPMHLAALCHEYWAIELPAVTREQRDERRDFTPDEMRAMGARLVGYRVVTIDDEMPDPYKHQRPRRI